MPIKKKPLLRDISFWIVILITYFALIPAWIWYQNKLNDINNASFIIINKEDMSLLQYDYRGELVQKFNVATGKGYGNKKKMGDLRTPEGVFTVAEIEDASKWKHNFGDGFGEIEGAYGPYFIRLSVPNQKGIGIHGTHDDKSILTRASEGCIRMHNEDVEKLAQSLKPSTVVVILPGFEDVIANFEDTIQHIVIKNKEKVHTINRSNKNPFR